MPKLVTSTMTKSLRAGKVFLDWSQNSGAKTTIAPYRCAAESSHRRGAATWEEIDDPGLRQLRYDQWCSGSSGRRLRRRWTTTSLPPAAPDPLPNTAAYATRLRPRSRCRSETRPAKAIGSSSRNTTPAGCTTISGWSATVCWCRGRCPRRPRPGGQSSGGAHRGPSAGVRWVSGHHPQGEYGAGTMAVWDTGTYETEKFDGTGTK